MINLSKSKVMAGLQCAKRLYFEVHQPELAEEFDERTLAVLEQGHEVGRLAQQLFPGGALIEAGHEELDRALTLTAAAVGQGRAPALFEAAFRHDHVLVRTDILERRPRSQWRLIEVKSGTQLKDEYVYDVAVQRVVLEGCGIKAAPCLMHLNRDYVYDGDCYELEKLFTTRELASETSALAGEVLAQIAAQQKMLAQPDPPGIAAGRQCEHPYHCEFFDVCNPKAPADDLGNLPGITQAKLDALKAAGVKRIGDIPRDFALNEKQWRARESVRTGRPWLGAGIAGALRALQYPLYFMDFETVMPALPRFAGMRPYDQLPFQWSLDIRRAPGGELEHREFLAADGEDPRRRFAESLCQAVGGRGSVVVYNQSFEAGRLHDLARWLPQHAGALEGIESRLWDLLALVRGEVYDAGFEGSYSLKCVLPALVPAMRYDTLAVQDGADAGAAWEKMVHGQVDDAERRRLRQALLAYCAQDTLGMVRILDTLAAQAPS